MEVEIISTECIKPSSPTPLHLKTYKLCLLDQNMHHIYAPCFLYYPLNLSKATDDIDHIVSKRLQLLKQSLSETLVGYYPLAGKLTDNFSVDCNDDGVYFVEAKAAKSPLNEFLKQPDLDLINKFFPIDGREKKSEQIAGAYLAKVQVTSFACGGLVICPCISHMFGDFTTFSSFLKSWAATARKETVPKNFPIEGGYCPANPSIYDASNLFPKFDEYPRELTWNAQLTRFLKTGRVVTRRFVFEAKAIKHLKAKVASSTEQNPTRVEAVSALISKCIMTAFKTKSGSHKPTLLSHVVNLRRKAKPPMSEHLLGNIIFYATALCTDEEVELEGLVSQFREAITKLDGDFVKSLQGDEGYHNFLKAIKDEAEVCSNAKDIIAFSSWCNLGFYEIDFGWGKPFWVSFAGFGGSIIPFSTFIILMDTSLGEGIEAWVLSLEEYMTLLEVDRELLAFSTMDPCPLR